SAQRQPKRLLLYNSFCRCRSARIHPHGDCVLFARRMGSRWSVHCYGDAIFENAYAGGRAAIIYHFDYLFAPLARRACFVQGMSATATLDRQSTRAGTLWKAALIAIPIVILLLLIWLRQLEVNALRQRTVSSYGNVPEFTLVNQDGKNFGSADLRGKIWIADFVYSTCPGPCPMISSRMSEL